MRGEVFPVMSVLSSEIAGEEQLGSKDKFWFRRDGRLWLFKEVRSITKDGRTIPAGEDWAEKVGAEIAHVLNIPAATVELAEYAGRWGCASRNFTSPAEQLMHGNEVMAGYLEGYDPALRYKQTSHTVDNIVQAIVRMFPRPREHRAVLRQLASYLILDALIGNVDRHHENWGLLWRVKVDVDDFSESVRLSKEYDVAPSFDHASSLGRELLDERRLDLLKRGAIESYVRHGRGGVYLAGERRGANPLGLVESMAGTYPDYFRPTLDVLRTVRFESLTKPLDCLPLDRITDTAREFAKAMLRVAFDCLRRT